jgi:hypothetical protein
MPVALTIRRVVLYKHGVGYFERRGKVSGSEALHLDFKARDMNDVLKSMTVLDLSGGSVSAVSYDSTKPLEQLLQEATIRIPDTGSLTALLGQIKGARVRVRVGGKESVEGVIVGLESLPVVEGKASVVRPFLALLIGASLRTFDILEIAELEFLDDAVRKDLEFYLATVLSSYKKDSKRMSILTAGEGERELFVSYVLEAPVWKTSYRILLEEKDKPLLQGWALVDNTGDEDWVDVDLALIAGLPVSFIHDLYSPRYMRRPIVEVRTEAAAAPVIPEEAFGASAQLYEEAGESDAEGYAPPPATSAPASRARSVPSGGRMKGGLMREVVEKSVEVKTLTKEVGDLFEYPMACIELKNTTGLTLEGGPVTVMEADTYVGEAMLDTMKPEDKRFVLYAVELSCAMTVEDSTESGPVFRSVVNRGTLVVEHYLLRRTKYVVRNKAKRPATLFLEHPRGLGAAGHAGAGGDDGWLLALQAGAGGGRERGVPGDGAHAGDAAVPVHQRPVGGGDLLPEQALHRSAARGLAAGDHRSEGAGGGADAGGEAADGRASAALQGPGAHPVQHRVAQERGLAAGAGRALRGEAERAGEQAGRDRRGVGEALPRAQTGQRRSFPSHPGARLHRGAGRLMKLERNHPGGRVSVIS